MQLRVIHPARASTAEFIMPQIEEFSFIAAQLEWLEGYLRKLPASPESSRLEGAVNALSCARAVMVELDHIGNSAPASQAAAG